MLAAREGYTGKERDAETHLDYFGARYYMAALGRWTSADPIAGFPGERHPQWSPYAYVLDNPLALVDPDGRQVAANGLNTPLASINGFRPPNVAGAFRQLRSDLNTAAALSGNPTLAAGAAGLGLLRFAGDLIGALDPAGAAGLGPGAVLESGAVAGTRMAGALVDDAAQSMRLLTAGETVPNAGGKITSFITQSDETFFRVFSERPIGGFLTRARPANAAIAQEGLALPSNNTADLIQQVLVPAGTRLQRSRALPAFGRRGGLEQFQLLSRIPEENFFKGVPFRYPEQ